MKLFKYRYLILIVLSILFIFFILLLQGCGGRKDILDIALTPKDKIPQILLYDPENGNQNAPLNTRISVVFSRPMNRESVESNFSYSYDNKTYGSASGYFDWMDDDTGFIFTPSVDFPPYTEITVIITNDAKSTDNVNLTNDLSWCFTTSGIDDFTQPYVLGSSPSDGSLVAMQQSISITFSEAMLKGTVESSFYLQSESGNDFRDNNNGYFEWDGNTVIYYPDEPLNENDLYYIYLNKNGSSPLDLAGNNLSSYTAFRFYTNSSEIYVSYTNGNDIGNYGTNRYSPFQTIAKALNYARNNTQFRIINIDYSNNYSEAILLNSTDYNGITIRGGWNSDFSQQDGTTTITDSNNYFVVTINGCSNINLENLEINSSTSTTTNPNGAINVDSSQNIVLNNLTLNASTSSGDTTYGLYIDDSTVTVNYCNINGGASSTENCGIYIIGSSDQTIVENSIITGGSAGVVNGIKIDGCSPTIENNQSISAGSTSSNPSYGMYITNSASPIIRDNHMIYGGDNNGDDSSDNTYGIYINGTNSIDIYRNTIVGGTESEGGSGDFNCGIYYRSVSSGNLISNFIVGGAYNTDSGNICYGIYLEDTTIKILNDTINGGGQTLTNGPSYSIYAICSGTWSINPIIINNLILGGDQNTTYGVYFNTTDSPITAVIFNNIFDDEKCTHLVSTSGVDINTISSLEGTIGSSSFDPDPKNNLIYSSDSDVAFINKQQYNYHIDVVNSTQDTLNVLSSNGFDVDSSSDPTYNNDTIYTPQDEALYDIDNDPRPTDYSKIDLGADEFYN